LGHEKEVVDLSDYVTRKNINIDGGFCEQMETGKY